MKFLGEALRGSGLRATMLGLMICAAGLLASCGGGTQVQKFSPGRVLAFGDEASVLDDTRQSGNARKYTVNFVDANTGAIDCTGNQVWVQILAQLYGFVFAQCNPNGVASPAAQTLAVVGAKASDVGAQIDLFLQGDGFRPNDLVALMAGTNDILELYRQYPNLSEAEATAIAEQRGTELATQVNRMANAGARVIISTIIDLGQSPFGATEKANHVDTDRAALLSRLTTRFNAKLRLGILNDGRKIGLLLADELVQTIVRFPVESGYTNVSDAVCDPAKAASVLDCTNATLVDGGSKDTWLWADAIHLSPAIHSGLGQLASSRALNNPF